MSENGAPIREEVLGEVAAEVAVEFTGPHALSPDEVRRRAAAGAATLGLRSALVLGMGVFGNLLLASLLAPRDFGLVALGTTLILVGRFLADGGLGVALIGRAQAPSRVELEAVFGLQLAVSAGMTVMFAAAALPFGRAGLVPALMVASVPLLSLRVPASIVLERDLRYRTIATVDIAEAVSHYVWAIGAVALGAGVWGLASAAVVRVLVGSAVMIRLGPLGLPRPRFSPSIVRPLLGFATTFQGTAGVAVVRDQGLNAGIAAIAGITTLGLWSFAWRIMQVPMLVFASMWRVSYPAMSQLIAAGEDPRFAIERSIGVTAVPTAVLVVGIAGAAPALPAVVGQRWSDVADVLPLCGLALMISTPVAVATLGYLFAAGGGRVVLFDIVLQSLAWFGVAFGLLPTVGVAAVGLGWVAGAVVDAVVLSRATVRRSGARIAANLLPPLAIATLAGAVGVAISTHGSERVVAGALGLAAGEAVLLGGLALLTGDLLTRTARTLRTALGAARTG